jgi:uncharacterized membrane protein YeaQ/YmgE (transglycosylase-associated protein family)
MDLGQIISLIIVGALAGTAATRVTGDKKKGNTLLRNTLVGILGALVGGFILHALDISLPDALSAGITVADIVVAFVGALIVIFIVRVINR